VDLSAAVSDPASRGQPGGQGIGARAAVGLGDRQAAQTEIAAAVPHGAIEAALAVARPGPGLDDRASEVRDAVVQGALLLAEREVHESSCGASAGSMRSAGR
jgi:hypothetical protein